jgi:hypothetical protein
MERNPLTTDELLALLPELTEEEEAELAETLAVTTTKRHPDTLDGVWATIKPEDYWA